MVKYYLGKKVKKLPYRGDTHKISWPFMKTQSVMQKGVVDPFGQIKEVRCPSEKEGLIHKGPKSYKYKSKRKSNRT